MANLTVKFVRPDKLLYEGAADHMILVTHTGELGVWPGHSSEICALGDGVIRIHVSGEDGLKQYNVVVSGGYAEICNNTVIVIADHARRTDDIDVETVQLTYDKAKGQRDALDPGDHNRAYYENKMAWCSLLLRVAGAEVQA